LVMRSDGGLGKRLGMLLRRGGRSFEYRRKVVAGYCGASNIIMIHISWLGVVVKSSSHRLVSCASTVVLPLQIEYVIVKEGLSSRYFGD
jgi:hypothetical protein